MYNDCRQSFTNLDTVTHELVARVAQLAMKAYNYMRGTHNKKTSAFVKACLAYCHITIPSLDTVFPRLNLFLQCGQVALINGMEVQAEAFFKAAISLIPNTPVVYEQGEGQKESTEHEFSDAYKEEVSEFLDELINELLILLSAIRAKTDAVSQKRSATLALDFVNTLISYFQMNSHSGTLVVKLYKLAKDSKRASPKYLDRTFEHIGSKNGVWYRKLLEQIS